MKPMGIQLSSAESPIVMRESIITELLEHSVPSQTLARQGT